MVVRKSFGRTTGLSFDTHTSNQRKTGCRYHITTPPTAVSDACANNTSKNQKRNAGGWNSIFIVRPPKLPKFLVFIWDIRQSKHGEDSQKIRVNHRSAFGFEIDRLNNLFAVCLYIFEQNEIGKYPVWSVFFFFLKKKASRRQIRNEPFPTQSQSYRGLANSMRCNPESGIYRHSWHTHRLQARW